MKHISEIAQALAADERFLKELRAVTLRITLDDGTVLNEDAAAERIVRTIACTRISTLRWTLGLADDPPSIDVVTT